MRYHPQSESRADVKQAEWPPAAGLKNPSTGHGKFFDNAIFFTNRSKGGRQRVRVNGKAPRPVGIGLLYRIGGNLATFPALPQPAGAPAGSVDF